MIGFRISSRFPKRGKTKDKCAAAFSLAEVLVVMAIMALLLAVSIPAFNQLTQSQHLSQSITSIANLLDYARTEAMAKNTYTWVGLHNSPPGEAGNLSGGDQVILTVMESLDGTSAAATGSIQPVTPLLRAPNLAVTKLSSINSAVQSLLPSSTTKADVTVNSNVKSLPSQQGYTFEYTVTFRPNGTATLYNVPSATSGFVYGTPPPLSGTDRIIDFAFLYRVGGTAQKPTLDFDIRLGGSSGEIVSYRL